MVAVPLSNSSLVVLIDSADAAEILKHRWRITPKGYAEVWRNKTHVFMHRMITGAPKGVLVDHINRDTLDNRRANLRLCTSAQNNWNRRSMGGSSRFKGVSLDSKSPRWRARIQKESVWASSRTKRAPHVPTIEKLFAVTEISPYSIFPYCENWCLMTKVEELLNECARLRAEADENDGWAKMHAAEVNELRAELAAVLDRDTVARDRERYLRWYNEAEDKAQQERFRFAERLRDLEDEIRRLRAENARLDTALFESACYHALPVSSNLS